MQVLNSFKKNAKMNVLVNQCIGMENPYNYRNKVQVPFDKRKKEVIFGFYKQGSHFVVNMKECYLQEKNCNRYFRNN